MSPMRETLLTRISLAIARILNRKPEELHPLQFVKGDDLGEWLYEREVRHAESD